MIIYMDTRDGRATTLNETTFCVAVFINQKVNIIEYKFNAIISVNKVIALVLLHHSVKANLCISDTRFTAVCAVSGLKK